MLNSEKTSPGNFKMPRSMEISFLVPMTYPESLEMIAPIQDIRGDYFEGWEIIIFGEPQLKIARSIELHMGEMTFNH